MTGQSCSECQNPPIGWTEQPNGSVATVDAAPADLFNTCWVHASPDERQKVIDKLVGLGQGEGHTIRNARLQGFDFSGIAFRNLVFAGGDFTGAQFKAGLLEDTAFRDCDMARVDFNGARLDRVNFYGVDGVSLDFSRARLTTCEFGAFVDSEGSRRSDLRQASFRRATLRSVRFLETTQLEESTFQAAALHDVHFLECKASSSDLQNLRADNVTFHNSDFARTFFVDSIFSSATDTAVFDDTRLEGSDFRRISMQLKEPTAVGEATGIIAFRDCEMPNCDFESAQLDKCLFVGGDATSCSFANAGLAKAHFKDCRLVATVFAGAYLQGTIFEGTAEGQALDLASARFENAVLVDATFDHTVGKASVFTAALLRRCVLRDCNFRNTTFDQAVFDECRLETHTTETHQPPRNVRFGDASLVGVSFERCFFDNVEFRDARLTGSTFKQTTRNSTRLDLTGADLSDADLRTDDFSRSDFARATLQNTALSATRLDLSDFDESRLSLCDLTDLKVRGVSFRGARLVDCSFDRSVFDECAFAGANLSGSSTVRPSLTVKEARDLGLVAPETYEADGLPSYRWTGNRTRFVNCDFSSADLTNCILVGADFSGKTSLKLAVVRGSDLRAAQLEGATAALADFGTASFSDSPNAGAGHGDKPDEDNLPLLSVRIEPAVLKRIVAVGASFQGATLSHCDLTGSCFDQARLDNADLIKAVVTDCTFRGASLIGVVGFKDVVGLGTSQRLPDFSYAYIQATQTVEIYRRHDWIEFRNWINGAGNTSALADTVRQSRRLSWVAWKNNFESLGLYAEQSECFREEQIARGWERLHRWRPVYHVLGLGVVLLAFLTVVGFVYQFLVQQFGDNGAFLLGITAVVLLVGAALIILQRSERFARRAVVSLMDLLYGFGEQPQKALANGVLAVSVFAAMYGLAVYMNWGGFKNPPDVLGAYLYFSVITFTTVGYGDLSPLRFCRFLSNCESLLGLVMAALFIHALARRTAGR